MIRTTAPMTDNRRNITFWNIDGNNKFTRKYIIEQNCKDDRILYAGKIKGRQYPRPMKTVSDISLSVKKTTETKALKEIEEAKTS